MGATSHTWRPHGGHGTWQEHVASMGRFLEHVVTRPVRGRLSEGLSEVRAVPTERWLSCKMARIACMSARSLRVRSSMGG